MFEQLKIAVVLVFVDQGRMIEPVKRPADVAVVPAAVKRPRTELVAAAQSQQLVATVRTVLYSYTQRVVDRESTTREAEAF